MNEAVAYRLSSPLDRPDVDESRMSARGLLATETRDRQGDVLLVSGLDLSAHRRNPVVMIDHGVNDPLPIGVTQDPDSGLYTVEIDYERGEVRQTTFFSESLAIAQQVFALIAENIIRACSIGFLPLEYEDLPPDPENGLHAKPPGKKPYMLVTRSQLVEASWCGIPVNPDAVRSALSRERWVGKSLAPELRRMLSPYLPAQRYWRPTAGKSVVATEMPASDVGRYWPPETKSLTPADLASAPAKTETAPTTKTPEGRKMADAEVRKPYGAEHLEELHKGMCNLMHSARKSMDILDNPDVKDHTEKCLEAVKSMAADTEGVHEAKYPQLDRLDHEETLKSMDGEDAGDDSDADGGEDMKSEEAEKPEGDEKKPAEDEKAMSAADGSEGGALVGDTEPKKSTVEGGEWREKDEGDEKEEKTFRRALDELREMNDRNERRAVTLGVL